MCAVNISEYTEAVNKEIYFSLIIYFVSRDNSVVCQRISQNNTDHSEIYQTLYLFADDVFSFFSNNRQTLDSIMDIFDQFFYISCSKIN